MTTYNPEQKGYVHSIETGGMVDGPGIRYVVFLAGCTLRCKYCHNPDTWKRSEEQATTVGEVLRDIKKYNSFMKFSGGGVTVTGGEPLGQPAFLAELLLACKESGLHTALDTSGHGTIAAAEKALPHTDLLLLDVKAINPAAFSELTGGGVIERCLAVLDMSKQLNIPVWARYVLVPGHTDNFDEIKKLAEFLKSYENIERIEVLPFHKMGEYKWAQMDIPYELTDVQPPSLESLNRAKEILELK